MSCTLMRTVSEVQPKPSALTCAAAIQTAHSPRKCGANEAARPRSASEAGSTPSAHALMSGLFPARRRAFALAVHSLGVPLGSMIGLMLGGWINDIANWRTAFFVVGLVAAFVIGPP